MIVRLWHPLPSSVAHQSSQPRQTLRHKLALQMMLKDVDQCEGCIIVGSGVQQTGIVP